jgi:hypothetical protein
MSSCSYTSDNYYKDCPARMSDGRTFTDFRSNCNMNNLLRIKNQVTNNFEYRMLLARNGDVIRDMNEVTAEKKTSCPGQYESVPPERSVLRCTAESCTIDTVDPNGIGQGRDCGVGEGCDSLANVSNLRNRVYKKASGDNCCGASWQSSGGYPYIENNLTISPRTPIGGL